MPIDVRARRAASAAPRGERRGRENGRRTAAPTRHFLFASIAALQPKSGAACIVVSIVEHPQGAVGILVLRAAAFVSVCSACAGEASDLSAPAVALALVAKAKDSIRKPRAWPSLCVYRRARVLVSVLVVQ